MSLVLDWCSVEAARLACSRWHYSRVMPAAKTVRIGVWEEGRFIGVVLFGVGSCRNLVKRYGLKPWEGCELTRVALDKHKAPVTRIVSIAIRMIRKRFPGLRMIVSFADPAKGHHGGIYQGGNWIYLGATACDRFAVVNGRTVHPRTVSDWVKRGTVKSRKELVYISVPGKHRYGYALDSGLASVLHARREPYPKAAEAGDEGFPGNRRRCDSDPAAPKFPQKRVAPALNPDSS